MTLRGVAAWALAAGAAAALGLGIAWAEAIFAIPKIVVQGGLLIALSAALGFAAWAGFGYYRAIRDEDDWD